MSKVVIYFLTSTIFIIFGFLWKSKLKIKYKEEIVLFMSLGLIIFILIYVILMGNG